MAAKHSTDLPENEAPKIERKVPKYIPVFLFFVEVMLVVFMIEDKGMSTPVLYIMTVVMGIILALIIGIFIFHELRKLKHRDFSTYVKPHSPK